MRYYITTITSGETCSIALLLLSHANTSSSEPRDNEQRSGESQAAYVNKDVFERLLR